ncbi:MAG TPA: hypothetical protein VFF86_01310 [Candidatus Methylomirabilis sp.]|nr:hypothetical protein [Candidatus Methylomirabilis sp.]
MTFGELLQLPSLSFGWLGLPLLAVPQLVTLTRSWALSRKGRTWFAWIGGLTSILALWVVVVGWLFFTWLSEGNEGVVSGGYVLWILLSVPVLLIEFLVFSALFVGLRTLGRRRAIAKPRLEQETP